VFAEENTTVNLQRLHEDTKKDRFSKVLLDFIRLLKSSLSPKAKTEVTREELMNLSMILYSTYKTEIERLVKTYESLKHSSYYPAKVPKYHISRNSVLVKPSSQKPYAVGINSSMQMIKPKPKSKQSTSKSIYTAAFPITAKKLIQNNRGMNKSSRHVERKESSKIAKQKAKDIYKLNHLESSFNNLHLKKVHKPSRNKEVKKSKSISEWNQNVFRIRRNIPEICKYENMASNSLDVTVRNIDDNKPENKDNDDYFSVSHNKSRVDQNSLNAVHIDQNEPYSNKINSLWIKATAKDDDKSKNFSSPYSRIKTKIKSWNSSLLPHGGGIEKLPNEERLNILTAENTPKIEAKATFLQREKSIDLSMNSGHMMNATQDILTKKLICSNKLSKYLTGFIGKKDYRTSEERELAKWTFNPRTYPKHRRYKQIKAKLSPYIKGKKLATGDESTKKRNLKTKIFRTKDDERFLKSDRSILSKSKHNESDFMTVKHKNRQFCSYNGTLKSNSGVFATESPNLESLLKFGYSHGYQQKRRSKERSQQRSTAEILGRIKRVYSPTSELKISSKEQSIRSIKASMPKRGLILKSARARSINEQLLLQKLHH
jgi:hypothetical protein